MSSRPIALVTGATRGIGSAVAHALAPTHDLLLGGRDRARLDELAGELRSARPWPVDLTDFTALAATTTGIERLDVLVHSAGLAELGTIEETPAEVWRRTMEVNLVAVVELTRLLLPALRASHGHVVLLNSGSGLRANPNWGAYAASKFALRAFGDVLRAEEAEHGIRVTSVHPGRTATDMQRSVREQEGGEFDPGQYLRPESVAAAVVSAVTASRDAHVTEVVIRPGQAR
ncbi:short chain dehydrogenase [Longimycelium tulufanense]|uniref:Short chain dehydrogenase n=1 Tax=Longimycelium tulufanense TaxID=907463 RepID=A0A8J3CGV0_9PSEU|nr:SDR family oxidoreductase [Longimycelium tulufanense]GGM67250.1 short chain dehydrogenase [Longimycelium tulufanense]